MAEQTSPRIFISYSHDSPEHMDRVLALSNRLRGERVDCHIDQYEQAPPEGWPTWCERQVEKAQFVLVVCTETYERRFRKEEEKGKGLGATWEGLVISHELYDAQGKNTKFIPAFFCRPDSEHIPTVLRQTTRYDLSTEKGYEELYRRLTNQPRITAPELGPLRTLPPLMRKMEQPSELKPGIVRLGFAGAGSEVFVSRNFKIISIWRNLENTDLLDGYSGHPLYKNNPQFGAGVEAKDINEELTHLVDLPESTAWHLVFYRLDFPPLQNCPFPEEVLRRVDAGETFSIPMNATTAELFHAEALPNPTMMALFTIRGQDGCLSVIVAVGPG